MRNEATAHNDPAAPVIHAGPDVPWRVVEAHAIGGLRLEVQFRDGTRGQVDLSGMIQGDSAGVFAALRDPDVFARVFIHLGAVTWPGGLDLAPDVMYDAIRNQGQWIPS